MRPCFVRVPTDNDRGGGDGSYYARWEKAGYADYKIVPVSLKVVEASPLRTDITVLNRLECRGGTILHEAVYSVHADGRIGVENAFEIGDRLPPPARIGMYVALPADYDCVEWFGRGPFESYEDRKESAQVGLLFGPGGRPAFRLCDAPGEREQNRCPVAETEIGGRRPVGFRSREQARFQRAGLCGPRPVRFEDDALPPAGR